ncbi:MAG: hypothetical protein ACKVKV_06395, partial [Dehalococcoidia bacterium]
IEITTKSQFASDANKTLHQVKKVGAGFIPAPTGLNSTLRDINEPTFYPGNTSNALFAKALGPA